ncbi:hypothetical protein [Flavobacterium sp. SM2513]|uniref:hypothetical protein n=1 Tax=Flavobacterium sp. SM2513 TaxID=3424766 RepID=UPI003D7F8BAD
MFKKVVYGIMAVIAVVIYSMQRMDLPLPAFVNNYVNDLLCMPLILGVLTFIIRRLKKDKYFTFPLLFVLFIASYYSVYFEYYLPKENARYTADWIDVALYFIGAIAYFLLEDKKSNSRSMQENRQ